MNEFDFVDIILDKAQYIEKYNIYTVTHNGKKYTAFYPEILVDKIKGEK